MGGGINAYTGREHVAFTGLVAAPYGIRTRLLRFSDAGVLTIELAVARTDQCSARAAVETVMRDLCGRGFCAEQLERARSALNAQRLIQSDRHDLQLELLARELMYPQKNAAPPIDITALNAALRSSWSERALLTW